jgi:hypothetical protein
MCKQSTGPVFWVDTILWKGGFSLEHYPRFLPLCSYPFPNYSIQTLQTRNLVQYPLWSGMGILGRRILSSTHCTGTLLEPRDTLTWRQTPQAGIMGIL